ncbi:DUF4435 domain-containing protein [Aeromonas caviae]|uniref:DUF4435 domain-containing protein n=1 Tax=Aeromonas caviae TaxID=648 RepID=UPI0021E099F6|nr:DUF4435 domain-containing protein [Aeromonas caviae]MCU9923775.1 DUF4435 domain-containing protein [Aeromonas caviae]
MRSYIDENDKKNEIRLLFRHPSYKNKIITVVEGDTDIRLFRWLLAHDKIQIESVDGKKNLVKLMEDLIKEYPEKMLAICDADFDHLCGKSKEREQFSIYVTDEHDAEVMLLKSPAFHSLINEYGSENNHNILVTGLFDSVFSAAYNIGLIRWINEEEKLNLKFKGLNFNKFITVDKLNIQVDLDSLLDEIFIRSDKIKEGTTKNIILSKMEEYKNNSACKFQVCSGHDLTNIISIIFRQKWASVDTNIDHKKVESSLRLGYQKEFFKNTNVFKRIQKHLEQLNVVFE